MPGGANVDGMDGDNLLGQFLRARRGLVQPEEQDVPVIGRRRVAGLRREEVAMLSGLSTDYYVRLEQGRERNPSVQVLDALARALLLDDDAIAHLHRLARPVPAPSRKNARRQRVSPVLRQMMDSGTGTPAVILGAVWTCWPTTPWAVPCSPATPTAGT